MNKTGLAAKLAQELGLPRKKAEEAVEKMTEIIIEELRAGDDVTIAGFGCFSARIRSARMGVNPRNPSERIQIPEVRVPKFKAGKRLKDRLKESTDV